MILQNKTCCVTGHRPSKLPWGYSQEGEAFDNYLKQLSFETIKLIDEGHTHFISGMALGVDMDFAELILWLRDEKELPITLECAIPCPNQTYRWKADQIDRYNSIIQRANKTTLVSDTYTPACMQRRNEYMIDNSDTIIAVWNGIQSGGTWNAIKYARNIQKNIFYLSIC